MARSGCLLSLLPLPQPKQLKSGLPRLQPSAVHPADRSALQRAQQAAEAADLAFSKPGVPDAAVADLAERLGAMLGVVHRLALGLMDARTYLRDNDPSRLAREQTDLEMRRLDASAQEILALRRASEALAGRVRLAAQVRTELSTLEAQLIAAGHDLEAFRGRVSAQAGIGAELGLELAAHVSNAEGVLEAYERTRREMSNVPGAP